VKASEIEHLSQTASHIIKIGSQFTYFIQGLLAL